MLFQTVVHILHSRSNNAALHERSNIIAANTKLTETQVRAALTRAQTKLARQRQAIAATEAEIAVFEQALKDATAK